MLRPGAQPGICYGEGTKNGSVAVPGAEPRQGSGASIHQHTTE